MLALLGTPSSGRGLAYEAADAVAVARYQLHAGLQPDGLPGPDTSARMVVECDQVYAVEQLDAEDRPIEEDMVRSADGEALPLVGLRYDQHTNRIVFVVPDQEGSLQFSADATDPEWIDAAWSGVVRSLPEMPTDVVTVTYQGAALPTEVTVTFPDELRRALTLGRIYEHVRKQGRVRLVLSMPATAIHIGPKEAATTIEVRALGQPAGQPRLTPALDSLSRIGSTATLLVGEDGTSTISAFDAAFEWTAASIESAPDIAALSRAAHGGDVLPLPRDLRAVPLARNMYAQATTAMLGGLADSLLEEGEFIVDFDADHSVALLASWRSLHSLSGMVRDRTGQWNRDAAVAHRWVDAAMGRVTLDPADAMGGRVHVFLGYLDPALGGVAYVDGETVMISQATAEGLLNEDFACLKGSDLEKVIRDHLTKLPADVVSRRVVVHGPPPQYNAYIRAMETRDHGPGYARAGVLTSALMAAIAAPGGASSEGVEVVLDGDRLQLVAALSDAEGQRSAPLEMVVLRDSRLFQGSILPGSLGMRIVDRIDDPEKRDLLIGASVFVIHAHRESNFDSGLRKLVDSGIAAGKSILLLSCDRMHGDGWSSDPSEVATELLSSPSRPARIIWYAGIIEHGAAISFGRRLLHDSSSGRVEALPEALESAARAASRKFRWELPEQVVLLRPVVQYSWNDSARVEENDG